MSQNGSQLLSFATLPPKLLAVWRANCAHAQTGRDYIFTPMTLNLRKNQMAEDVRDTSTNSVTHSFLSGVKYEHLVAGLSGGVISTLATHPFDLIKLRFAGELVR